MPQNVEMRQVRPSHAVATARAMARTAWPGRLAFFDPVAGRIAELLPGEPGHAGSPSAATASAA